MESGPQDKVLPVGVAVSPLRPLISFNGGTSAENARVKPMDEISRKWRAELGKSGPELSARTIRSVMSFLDGMRLSTAVVARALLGLCTPGGGRRVTNIPLLEDTSVTMDDLLSCEAVRRQCPDAASASYFIQEEMDRLRAARFDWWREAGLRVWDQAVPYGDDEFLDIVEVAWSSDLDTHRSWRVRGGQWAYWGMNALGRLTLCRLARASLALRDKASVDLAAKLMIHVALSGGPQSVGSRSSFEIGPLLEQIGELPPRERRTPEWARDTEHRLEAALRALVEAGALTELAFPTTRHALAADVPTEKWLHAQLQLAVVLAGPEAANGTSAA